jgi:hypothetical protein
VHEIHLGCEYINAVAEPGLPTRKAAAQGWGWKPMLATPATASGILFRWLSAHETHS